MLFHTMIGSNDIERSRRFYNSVLEVLGIDRATVHTTGSGHTRLFYGGDSAVRFVVTEPINDQPATVANGSTVAFTCKSPDEVRRFQAVALENGGTAIEMPAGPRESMMGLGTIHLAYVRDPDGNKLCGIYIPKGV